MYRLCVHLAADRIGIASSNTPKEARRFQVDKIAAAGFGKFFWRFEILKFSEVDFFNFEIFNFGNLIFELALARHLK
jgi:hypothetical protein